MSITTKSTFLLPRLLVGYQQDDLRANPGQASEHQVPMQGDPNQHQAVREVAAEADGLRDIHETGSTHGKSQVQRISVNVARQLQE